MIASEATTFFTEVLMPKSGVVVGIGADCFLIKERRAMSSFTDS